MSDFPMAAAEEGFTGRLLVTDVRRDGSASIKELKKSAGLSIAHSRDFAGQDYSPGAMGGDGVYLDEIGVAVVTPHDADQVAAISETPLYQMTAEAMDGKVVEPERIVHAIGDDLGGYVRGLRDAADLIARRIESAGLPALPEAEAGSEELAATAANATWGLIATRVVPPFHLLALGTGAGIRVAVLDTGMDTGHPDFVGRTIVTQSFIAGETAQDGHSHGTHCIGTACGPLAPASGVQRYGVAHKAEIYVGKVLNNAGSGADGEILAGINWAIANGCAVISMSLGASASGSGFSAAYENAAQAAFQAGCLIIAAAGNEGNLPVNHPANCPSIMAVGALAQDLTRAPFSCIGSFPPHGSVDIAGPGVGVFSSVPVAKGTHGTKNGTSMATPHVAGIAALYAGLNPAHRGAALWQRLIATARPLPGQPAAHVGAGNVQAPVRRKFILNPFPKLPIFDKLPIPRPPELEPAGAVAAPKRKGK